ncbi:PH domain-containing protein [Arthrobacter sp. 92]|uniref:PH domain-containing protein n=1 Tax=Arthrobacter sp. 92 TaxID=3418175 RepID=UPI003D085CF0
MRKDLQPGEQVIVVTRPQPRKLIFPVAVFILVPAVGAFASAWIVRGEPARLFPLISKEWTFWLVAACVAAVAWILLGYCLPRVLRWQATRYVLTNRRIVARYGMLRRRDQQISLVSIRHVGVSQSLLQRIFRSGNISLDTGHGEDSVVPDVPEVLRFRNFVLEAMDDLPPGVVPEADGWMDPGGDAARHETWHMREGGRDER